MRSIKVKYKGCSIALLLVDEVAENLSSWEEDFLEDPEGIELIKLLFPDHFSFIMLQVNNQMENIIQGGGFGEREWRNLPNGGVLHKEINDRHKNLRICRNKSK